MQEEALRYTWLLIKISVLLILVRGVISLSGCKSGYIPLLDDLVIVVTDVVSVLVGVVLTLFDFLGEIPSFLGF